MATQGLISIVSNNEVQYKIIAGCEGFNCKELKAAIMERKIFGGIKELYELAIEKDLGCNDCLVVQDKESIYYNGEKVNLDTLPSLYEEKFHDANFNPRWARGLADYVEIITITKQDN